MSKLESSRFVYGCLAALVFLGSWAEAKPPVKPPPAPAGCPACEIVYTQAADYTNGPQDLMLMKKDGSSKTTLLAGGRKTLHKAPAWAPDGTWIAFITNADPKSTLRLVRNDGTGLTNVVERCSVRFGRSTWNPVLRGGGYWLVYSAARDATGACIVDPAPGIGWPSQNLWGVHVSLGVGLPPVVGDPVCLTCGLNPNDQDLWDFPRWSRDGDHLSAFQRRYDANGVTNAFYIFDVSFEGGVPALVPSEPFVIPGLDYPRISVPSSWAHFSDSLLLGTRDDVAGTRGLLRLDFVLDGDHEISNTTLLTEGSSHNFNHAIWSPLDDQLVYDYFGSGSAQTDGIYVITLAPFSLKQIAPSKPKMVDYPDWKPLVP